MELALNAAPSSSGFTFDDFFQWGRDAVKDGTPKPSYTPYTYPHPLRG